MSQSTSESSFWSVTNIIVAVLLSAAAGYWPICFAYGGIKASYNIRHPETIVAQAQTTAPGPAGEAPVVSAAPAAASAPEAGGDLAAQVTAGQQVYMAVCFACHQPTGLGLPNMFPPLAGSDWVTAPKPDRIIRNVLHGVTGPITINGKPFTTPAPLMPPQGGALTDVQIANVLTYVRNSWGNQASAVTADQVKAIRETEKARTAMWTEAELLKISDH